MFSKEINISVCGVGHLGGSMLLGFLKSGIPPSNILGIVRDKEKAEIKYKGTGVRFTENAEDMLNFNGDKVHVLILSIPPKLVKAYIKNNITAIRKCDPILVNACAGMMYSQIRGWLLGSLGSADISSAEQHWNPKLCIAMPSISIATREGIVLSYLKHLSESDSSTVINLLEPLSKQVICVNEEHELYGSVYVGGSFPGIISYLFAAANEELKNIGFDPEPLKHVVPSMCKSIGSAYASSKSNMLNHTAAPRVPCVENDEILSLIAKAVDPNSGWYHKLSNAADCSVNRHIDVSELLDQLG